MFSHSNRPLLLSLHPPPCEMSTGQTRIDRRKCHRDRPLEVLALGPGRTGTDSIRVALKTLGFDDCYHGYSCLHENPPDNYMWNEAADAKFLGRGKPFDRSDWDRLLGHCRAVADLPCVAFAPELVAAYPEAKVILTLPPRGFERWYESCCTALLTLKEDRTRDAWAFFHHEAWITRKTFWRMFDHFYRGDFRRNARAVFEEHNDMIRRSVPRERLLEYSVSEGWYVDRAAAAFVPPADRDGDEQGASVPVSRQARSRDTLPGRERPSGSLPQIRRRRQATSHAGG